jgi:hypothetical protein
VTWNINPVAPYLPCECPAAQSDIIPFSTGNGWSLIDADVVSWANAQLSGGKGLINVHSAGVIHGLESARIEHDITPDPGVYQLKATVGACTGDCYPMLYVRSGGASLWVMTSTAAANKGHVFAFSPFWTQQAVIAADVFRFDGTCALGIRGERNGNTIVGYWDNDIWNPVFSFVKTFNPDKVGVSADADGGWTGQAVFNEFLMQSVG